jgi:hypothetical protein
MRYAYNYSSEGGIYNLSRYLTVPAAKSRVVETCLVANFTPAPPVFPVNNSLYLHEDDSVTIWVITALQNVYEETFRPPIPSIKTRIESEDLTVAQRSILVLDGSGSTDDGTVVRWNWTLLDGSNTTPQGNWSDTANVKPIPVPEGKVVSLSLPDPGPFQVSLKVTDDTGMTGTSRNVTIPINPGFNPPVAMFVDRTGLPQINVTVKDIANNPVSGVAVIFIKTHDTYGNLSLSTWSNTTDSSGNVSTTVRDGTGIITVESGKLPPVDVAV